MIVAALTFEPLGFQVYSEVWGLSNKELSHLQNYPPSSSEPPPKYPPINQRAVRSASGGLDAPVQ